MHEWGHPATVYDTARAHKGFGAIQQGGAKLIDMGLVVQERLIEYW